jgi:alkenylglycerophosphocholine hydrolase
MTTAALVLLGIAAVVAVANWVSRVRDDHRLEVLTKPTATLLLLGVALALDPEVPAQQAWVAAGLALSLVGDVLLLPQVERFVGGIAAFLLAHLAFVGGFAAAGIDAQTAAVAAVAVTVLALPVAWRLLGALRASEDRGLVGPVVVYLVVIAAMVAAAAGTGSRLALAGAAVFLLSDTILAWNRFVRPLPFGRPAVMITYHLGLTGIVLALV